MSTSRSGVLGRLRTLAGWLLAVLIPVLAFASPDRNVTHKRWTDEYDALFRKYAKHYFGPGVDWHWFKAQGIAESGLRPKVKSKAGAVGIMQIMPGTYNEIKEKNPHFLDISEPRWNIAAAIYYDRQMYKRWAKGVPGGERLRFAFASYNAGYGNVRKAFRRAKKKHDAVRQWAQVEPFAPRETRRYVERIHLLMEPRL
jgi:membrane-bound lytic murein transglycosylase F